MQAVLTIEDLDISIELKRQRRKTLAITVTEEGRLQVKAPLCMPEREIERFLQQREYWIYKQMKRMLQQNKNKIERSEMEELALRQQAEKVLRERTEYYSKKLGVTCQAIRIGDQKTFWGSCSSRGRISYNWHLILMPERILDYVVVHELCHLVQMNHSSAFWSLLEGVIPDYKECRKWLKEHGNECR